MASPMRLDAELVQAAEKESKIQKRSIPKQIEYWAALGKAVEKVIDQADVFAVLQGLKRVIIEPVDSAVVDSEAVFCSLEESRQHGDLSQKVTSAPIFYEACQSRSGLLDRVNTVNGERQTGQFRNATFEIQE